MIGYDRYCDCIESQLPNLNQRQSVKAIPIPDIERHARGDSSPTPESNTTRMLEKLDRCKLESWEKELIIDRFVEGKTLQQIMMDQGWTSVGSAEYHLKKTLNKLKIRGYK